MLSVSLPYNLLKVFKWPATFKNHLSILHLILRLFIFFLINNLIFNKLKEKTVAEQIHDLTTSHWYGESFHNVPFLFCQKYYTLMVVKGMCTNKTVLTSVLCESFSSLRTMLLNECIEYERNKFSLLFILFFHYYFQHHYFCQSQPHPWSLNSFGLLHNSDW